MRLFSILWVLGMTGVVSLLWLPLPIAELGNLPLPLWQIRLLSLIQPTILLSGAVLIGVALAHRVKLSAPLAEALARGGAVYPALKPQLVPGIIGGLSGGVALTIIQRLAEHLLPSDFIVKATAFSADMPIFVRLLYGGITEELLLRWGLMTLFVWIGWRVFTNGRDLPSPRCVTGAIALSTLLFAVGHIPLAFALGTEVTPSVLAYVLIGNSVFGLIAGYLYWRVGLEAAILAHMLVHIVLVTVESLTR